MYVYIYIYTYIYIYIHTYIHTYKRGEGMLELHGVFLPRRRFC